MEYRVQFWCEHDKRWEFYTYDNGVPRLYKSLESAEKHGLGHLRNFDDRHKRIVVADIDWTVVE